MTILSKINWEVSESTSVDFFSSLLDYIHVTTHNRKVVGLDAKKVLLHFLAKQLTNFETARIPPLELAFGLFMVAFKKYSSQVKFRYFPCLKKNPVPRIFQIATTTARLEARH